MKNPRLQKNVIRKTKTVLQWEVHVTKVWLTINKACQKHFAANTPLLAEPYYIATFS